ncbi:UNVERIFIED_CONTAM: hypothetical protein H355_016790, partial [Colinus virginianus]
PQVVACCTPLLLEGEHHHAAELSFASTEPTKAAEEQGRFMEACADVGFVRLTPRHDLCLSCEETPLLCGFHTDLGSSSCTGLIAQPS